MYIHFSLYQFMADVGSLYVLVPEKLLKKGTSYKEIKHRKKVILIGDFESNIHKNYYIVTQDKKIKSANHYLFFEFPAQTINFELLLDDSKNIDLKMFFNLIPLSNILNETNISGIEFKFLASANFNLDLQHFENLKFYITNLNNQILVKIPDLDIVFYSNKKKYIEKDYGTECYYLYDMIEMNLDLFEEILLDNYPSFL